MSNLLKYGVSVLALAVGIGAADAQNMDKQQGQSPGSAQTQRDDAGSGDHGPNVEQKKRGSSDGQKQGQSQGEHKERMSQSDESRDKQDGRDDHRSKGAERSDGKDQRTEGRSEGPKQAEQGQGDKRDGTRVEGRKKTHVRVNITPQKKTVIRERVFSHAPRRYGRNDVHFSLSIGTAIPSNFAIYPVSPEFAEIVPEYQGYDYIVVGDVILVIDPETREIVDVIDV